MSETKLVGLRKAASVIVAIGVKNASEAYRYLKEDEIEQLIFEITRLDQLTVQGVGDTLDDFYQVCLTQKVITEGGMEYVRNILEKAYGPQMVSSLLERVTCSLRMKVSEFIRKTDYKNITTIIQNEHPQTIVLILSYTNANQTASVIGELSKDVRFKAVERIATMNRTSPGIVKIVEQNLEKGLSLLMFLGFTEIDGVNYIADVTSSVDRTNEKYTFDKLTHKDAALYGEIRKRMFVFEGITAPDGMSIQRFLYGVDSKDLVFALEGANREAAETIFKNMSARSSESVRSDLEYTHNVRLHNAEEAQQRVVGIIHRLESEGKPVIVKGGKDEFIA